ncbi:hypothetical protein, partial [Rhizobium lusitanum]|uniref:hypothetical protein n=1 Tax=Rhizobium lusitanum TaxID=293958 RepID=UPI001FD44050
VKSKRAITASKSTEAVNHNPLKTKTILWVCDLEQFQEKCVAVFRPELRKNNKPERSGDSVKRATALAAFAGPSFP